MLERSGTLSIIYNQWLIVITSLRHTENNICLNTTCLATNYDSFLRTVMLMTSYLEFVLMGQSRTCVVFVRIFTLADVTSPKNPPLIDITVPPAWGPCVGITSLMYAL